MYSQEDFNTIKDIIQKHVTTLRYLILFGSYATGKADEKSDVDLAIITDHKLERKEKLHLLNTLWLLLAKHGYEADLVIKSSAEYADESAYLPTLAHTLTTEGENLMETNGLDTIVANWKIKAEHDLTIVEQGMKAEPVMTDVLCFHCQQAVEKYLKLYLVSHQIDFPKTHNIAVLLEECKKLDNAFNGLDDVVYLTEYAVELRYPDNFSMPNLEELQEAYQKALKVKEFVLAKMIMK